VGPMRMRKSSSAPNKPHKCPYAVLGCIKSFHNRPHMYRHKKVCPFAAPGFDTPPSRSRRSHKSQHSGLVIGEAKSLKNSNLFVIDESSEPGVVDNDEINEGNGDLDKVPGNDDDVNNDNGDLVGNDNDLKETDSLTGEDSASSNP
jgi:hypothetical protein